MPRRLLKTVRQVLLVALLLTARYKRLLVALGTPKVYNVSNPFEWMDMISLQGKTNFFEKRVGDYQKAGVMSASKGGTHAFKLDADF